MRSFGAERRQPVLRPALRLLLLADGGAGVELAAVFDDDRPQRERSSRRRGGVRCTSSAARVAGMSERAAAVRKQRRLT